LFEKTVFPMMRIADQIRAHLPAANSFRDGLKRFASHQGGAVAIVLGLSMLPIAGLVGATIDYSRASNARSSIQDAGDAAALAVASSGLPTRAQREALARAMVVNNLPGNTLHVDRLELLEGSGEYEVQIRAHIEASLLGVFGIDTVNVGTRSVAIASSRPVELAIIFDATNSMRFGNRWQAATSGVDHLLTSLDDATDGRNGLMVSLIPMSDRINVGRGYQSWLGGAGSMGSWTGCLEPRIEALPGEPYRVTNATPADLPFVAHTGDSQFLQSPQGGYRTPVCPSQMAGPTHNIRQIMRGMDQMTTNGTGRFDEGMAWGWRALTPSWRGFWHGTGSNYPASLEDARKAVLFVSDGNSIIEDLEFDGTSEFGWNNGGRASFDALVRVCENMQAQGIEIFMFYVQGNPFVRPFFEDCASSPQHFFDVT
jgi:Flp pilus assembly protein TadG